MTDHTSHADTAAEQPTENSRTLELAIEYDLDDQHGGMVEDILATAADIEEIEAALSEWLEQQLARERALEPQIYQMQQQVRQQQQAVGQQVRAANGEGETGEPGDAEAD